MPRSIIAHDVNRLLVIENVFEVVFDASNCDVTWLSLVGVGGTILYVYKDNVLNC